MAFTFVTIMMVLEDLIEDTTIPTSIEDENINIYMLNIYNV